MSSDDDDESDAEQETSASKILGLDVVESLDDENDNDNNLGNGDDVENNEVAELEEEEVEVEEPVKESSKILVLDNDEEENVVNPTIQEETTTEEINNGLEDLDLSMNTLQTVDLQKGGENNRLNSELNITRLDDIDLSPDLEEQDMEQLVNTNLEITTPVIQGNEEVNISNNELNSEELLNDISNEISELGTSMHNIRQENSSQVQLEHKDMPTEKKEDNVKVIRLEVDKNMASMMKK